MPLCVPATTTPSLPLPGSRQRNFLTFFRSIRDRFLCSVISLIDDFTRALSVVHVPNLMHPSRNHDAFLYPHCPRPRDVRDRPPTGMRCVNRRAINGMPAEVAVTAPNGVTRPYRRAAANASALRNSNTPLRSSTCSLSPLPSKCELTCTPSKHFSMIKAGDACSAGPKACAGTQFAQCAGNNTYVTTACAALAPVPPISP